MTTMIRFQSLIIIVIGAATACGPDPNAAASQAVQAPFDSAATADAVAVASQRLQEHGDAGLSLVDVTRTRSWFTPELYALLVKDMSSDPGGVGYLNWDPFTGAQDDAGPWNFENVRNAGDTIMVRFAYQQNRKIVILAMRRFGGSWRIANFIYPDAAPCHQDLAVGLARYANDISGQRSTTDRACRE